MAYTGNSFTNQAYAPTVAYFSGNASTTAFTLPLPVASVAQLIVVIENVPQNPSSAYTVSGQTITFTSAPPSGTNNIWVEYTSPITQVIAPSPGTVSPTQINPAYALWNLSGSDINYTAGNVGIGGIPAKTLSVLPTSIRRLDFYVRNPGTDDALVIRSQHAINNNIRDMIIEGSFLRFYTGADSGSSGSEAMRIDSSGRMLINATASVDNNARIQVFSTAGNGNSNWIASLAGGSGGTNANQTVGYMVGQTNCQVYAAWDGSGNARNSVYVSAVSQGVQLSSGASSWSAISDERKKDIIEPITDATNKVSTLRAVIGKYKNDEENKRRSFLIAQDVQAVLPEAVTIEDEGQETEKLLLSYTDVIPLLVAAIQELKAEVDALKGVK